MLRGFFLGSVRIPRGRGQQEGAVGTEGALEGCNGDQTHLSW